MFAFSVAFSGLLSDILSNVLFGICSEALSLTAIAESVFVLVLVLLATLALLASEGLSTEGATEAREARAVVGWVEV